MRGERREERGERREGEREQRGERREGERAQRERKEREKRKERERERTDSADASLQHSSAKYGKIFGSCHI